MIRIHRDKKPEDLTNETINQLTEEFKNSGKDVWNKSFIKKSLLEMTNEKCAYCEIKLKEEGKYMHVEHFHPKSIYPEEVVKWDNLLPACPHCNANKGNHDTYQEPIIDPTNEDPKDYLYLKNYRYKSINDNALGKNTIDVLSLNVSDEMVMPRFKVGESINEKLGNILELIELYEQEKSTKRRNKVVNTMLGLMREGHPHKEYSALVATLILEDSNYPVIKDRLYEHGLWDQELENANSVLEEIALLDKDFVVSEQKNYIMIYSNKEDSSIEVYACSAGDGFMIEGDEAINYACGDFPEGTDYLVKINGKSMEPLIPDGSYVPVKRKEMNDNKIGIISYNGNFMCKKYKMSCNKLILETINPDFENLVIDLTDETVTYKHYGEVICRSHNKPYIFYEKN